jgi:hypothetical protein
MQWDIYRLRETASFTKIDLSHSTRISQITARRRLVGILQL